METIYAIVIFSLGVSVLIFSGKMWEARKERDEAITREAEADTRAIAARRALASFSNDPRITRHKLHVEVQEAGLFEIEWELVWLEQELQIKYKDIKKIGDIEVEQETTNQRLIRV
jgi:hypothetical protein